MSNFSSFGLAAPLLKALASEGYTIPTPIQSRAIPQVMTGRDLLGIAQTGTGKTAAFALPILHHLAETGGSAGARACRALVLAPTRELARQIADSFRSYGRHLRLTTEVVYGGVSIGRQESALARGVDILVATPGRLLDLVDRRALGLRAIEILVLDEADQMLDLGFIHDLKRIVKLLPAERQSLFFSATMPKAIASLAQDFLTDPVEVAVTPVATTVERIDDSVIFVSAADKPALLAGVLADPGIGRALVFTRTKHGADKLVRRLAAGGIGAAAMHGNKSQPQRERALAAFRSGSCPVLVATDIAARGIDVEAVTHVINFDLPNVAEAYVHRIGRTARAGACGVAVAFCSPEERPLLRDIETLIRRPIPVSGKPPGFEAAEPRPAPASARPARHGGARRDEKAVRSKSGYGPRSESKPRTKSSTASAPRRTEPRARPGEQGGSAIGWLAGAVRSPTR